MTTEHAEAQAAATSALATVSAEITELTGWEIETDEDNDFAGEMLANIKGRFKALEAKRKEITVPMNKALRAVNDLFREPKARLEECERLLKEKLTGYLEQAAEENDEAYAVAGAAETAEEAVAALASVRTVEAPKGVNIRYVWKASIVAEDLVMPQFMSPDMGKIEAWAKEHVDDNGKPTPIPGVLFDRIPIVRSRSA